MGLSACMPLFLALVVAVSCWHLRLERTCQAGEPPSGTNHTLVYADTFIDCATACDVNTHCYYVSFHGTACVMYGDESPCGTGVGPTRDVYKVDPPCESGWQRYRGRCYLVVQNNLIAGDFYNECVLEHDAFPMAIRNEAEGKFLTQLLQFINVSASTVWLGGGFNPSMSMWHWASMEPVVYRNWVAEEPVTANASNTICIVMYTGNATWQGEHCLQEHVGVCEKRLK